MKKSTPKMVIARKELDARRRAVFRKIEKDLPLIVGNVYDVLRRCGNPSCHCAATPCHRQTLYMSVENGRRHCKLVRRGDETWVKAAWRRYREYKLAVKAILAINKLELGMLRGEMSKRRVRYK